MSTEVIDETAEGVSEEPAADPVDEPVADAAAQEEPKATSLPVKSYLDIDIEKIIEPLAKNKTVRKLKPEDVDRMATSLEVDGQLQPIIVRPLSLEEGSEAEYEVVTGRTRLLAARQLGWESIKAEVRELSDEDADIVRITENLIRSDLKGSDLALAIKRWEKRVSKIAPHRVGKAASGHASAKARSNKKSEDQKADPVKQSRKPKAESGDSPDVVDSVDAVDSAPEPKAEKTFIQEVAEKTGQSERQVSRVAKIARSFTEEQLEILKQMDVPVSWQEKLANIPDKEARDAAIKKVSLGVEPEDAFNQAMKELGAESEAGKDDLSDDEWLEQECGDVLGRLTTEAAKNAYKRDAILYRRTREMRVKLRKKLQGILEELSTEVTGTKKGRLFRNVFFFNNVVHPKHWKVCSSCGGSGTLNGKTCPHCLGDGYKVDTEVARK